MEKGDVILDPAMFAQSDTVKNQREVKETELDVFRDVVEPIPERTISKSESGSDEFNDVVDDDNTTAGSVDNDLDLPSTTTVFDGPDGSKVYLVGTAHFSLESQEDVSKVIRQVKPHIVMVELCQSRACIILTDEATIEREVKELSFQKLRGVMRQYGLFQGMMHILLLNINSHLTKTLGMAPGGEFRRALMEVRQIPNCVIHFGDRPIHITLKRALSVLSWWQCIRLSYHLLFSNHDISKEDIEKLKQRDLLETTLLEMAKEFPQLGSVLIDERDIYLTYSLQLGASANCVPNPASGEAEAMRVVGIVGIGHVPGIQRLWGTICDDAIPPIMVIPEPTQFDRFVKVSVKAAVVGLLLWGAYKIVPVPKCLTDTTWYITQPAVASIKAII